MMLRRKDSRGLEKQSSWRDDDIRSFDAIFHLPPMFLTMFGYQRNVLL